MKNRVSNVTVEMADECDETITQFTMDDGVLMGTCEGPRLFVNAFRGPVEEWNGDEADARDIQEMMLTSPLDGKKCFGHISTFADDNFKQILVRSGAA